ncbi:MAG: hypothetical protein QOJ29_1913 [Thermoleophilaceae bacterium]|jgi:hypothetical protein|nr:hypothetical protein [Thermoleophilaceae bacterium]
MTPRHRTGAGEKMGCKVARWRLALPVLTPRAVHDRPT